MADKKFKVGRTIGDGKTCIIYDGDSVLCTIPAQPVQVAIDYANGIALALNAHYDNNFHNMPGMPDDAR